MSRLWRSLPSCLADLCQRWTLLTLSTNTEGWFYLHCLRVILSAIKRCLSIWLYFDEKLLFTGLHWGSSGQRICLRHGWVVVGFYQRRQSWLPKLWWKNVFSLNWSTAVWGATSGWFREWLRLYCKLDQVLYWKFFSISRKTTWMEYILLHLLRKKIQVCTSSWELFALCFHYYFSFNFPSAPEGELRFLCSVIPRWLWVPGDPERRCQRQHQQPRTQHCLDWSWWLSSGPVSSLDQSFPKKGFEKQYTYTTVIGLW